MPPAARIMVAIDPSRGRGEPRVFAEVVARPGEGETVLYTTPYRRDVPAAIADAEAWMREYGVAEAEV